ncbi:MAG: Xaa-Pro peptidase family protein [Bacteroidota bacterium]|nr:Xaa-Pro peptidase family protein [Candidatus Kapabacteria bacterium]MDW8219982.1 Xaa-Pro peptidase family protein [Bacteroidota bacterium]
MTAYTQRIEALRNEFEKHKIDAFCITHIPHVAYLTGFSGSSGMVILTATEGHLLTDARYTAQAQQEVMLPNMAIHTERDWWGYIKSKNLLSGAKCVGFEAAHTSVASAEQMKRALEDCECKGIVGVVERIVMVKTPEEVEHIRCAAAIAARTYEHIIQIAKAGMTEQDIAAEVVYMARKLGSESEGFETIVASGIRGALPHGRASHKAIRHGELVTLDFGCRVHGFYSDMTRTFAVGEPTAFQRALYALVLTANEQAIAAARGGMTCGELDTIARNILDTAGYGQYFVHGLGHGLGREVHEKPSISYRFAEDILPEGVVITIEPGVYLPEQCGIRIEDNIWLTSTGCEVLTSAAPKHLLVIE